MKKLILILGCAAALLAPGMPVGAQGAGALGQGAVKASPPKAPASIAGRTVLMGYAGRVDVFRPGSPSPERVSRLPLGLEAGDEVRVGRDGEGTIQFKDMSRVRLGSGAVFTVRGEAPERISLYLAMGKLWAVVTKNRYRRFEVMTPIAVTSVRGTEFSVEVKSLKQAITEVQSGIVAVQGWAKDRLFGEEILLRVGQMVSVVSDKNGFPQMIQGIVPSGGENRSGPSSRPKPKSGWIITPQTLAQAREKISIGREVGLELSQDLRRLAEASSAANSVSSEGGLLVSLAASQQQYAADYESYMRKSRNPTPVSEHASAAGFSSLDQVTPESLRAASESSSPGEISAPPTASVVPTMVRDLEPTAAAGYPVTSMQFQNFQALPLSYLTGSGGVVQYSYSQPSGTTSTTSTSLISPTSPTYTTTCPTCPAYSY